MHQFAMNILNGPDYQGLISYKRGEGPEPHDQIILTIPFRPPAESPDIIETIYEELSTGVYLPRSSATRGLTEKKDGPDQ